MTLPSPGFNLVRVKFLTSNRIRQSMKGHTVQLSCYTADF